MKHITLILILSLVIQGCANQTYLGRFETTGKFQPEKNLAIEEKSKEMKWNDASDIEVYIGELPEGVSWDGKQFYSDKYDVELIGNVHTNPGSRLYLNYAEDDTLRTYLCPINIPLAVATIGFWVAFSPVSWVCGFKETNESEDIAIRKSRMIKTLKKTVKAAGGNTLIVTSLGRTDYINKNSNELVSSTDMTNSEGMALLITPKAPLQSKL